MIFTVWFAPQATSPNRTPWRVVTHSGVFLVAVPPSPSLPESPHPNVKSRPSLVITAECLKPAATLDPTKFTLISRSSKDVEFVKAPLESDSRLFGRPVERRLAMSFGFLERSEVPWPNFPCSPSPQEKTSPDVAKASVWPSAPELDAIWQIEKPIIE